MIGHIAKSFASNIVLGCTLYGLDIGKDIDYSLDIYETKCNITKQDVGNGTMNCLEDSRHQAIIGFAHIIVPHLVALLIGVFTLPWFSLPLPPITKGYRFYLDARHALFKGREEPTEDKQDEKLMDSKEKKQEFQIRKKSYEIEKAGNKEVQEMLKKNNIDNLMAQQVECIGESSFQFFTQTLWLMPSLVMETTSLEDLFKNKRVIFLVLSFISMGISYSSIRL